MTLIKNLESIRSQIPALSTCAFLNTGGISPKPLTVTQSLVSDYEEISKYGEVALPVYERIGSRIETTRTGLADLIGAEPDSVALLHSTTEGINIVLNSFRWVTGDEIITTDSENNALAIALADLARREGLVIRKLNIGPGSDSAAQAEMLVNRRTRLVAVSHVTHTTGQVLPMRRIIEIAHDAGARVLCDGAHAAGQIPVDCRELRCDYYVGAGYKWLLGPWGTGFMVVRPDRINELDSGWVGVGSEESFDEVSYALSLKPVARRFEFGGKSWPLTKALGEGINFVNSVGIDAIVERQHALERHARRLVSKIDGAEILSAEGAQGSGLFSIALRGRDVSHLVSKLWQEYRVLVQWRRLPPAGVAPTGLRFSFAFFTLEDELDRAFRAVTHLID